MAMVDMLDDHELEHCDPQDLRRLVVQLRDSLERRELVAQAKGILMERHRVASDEAFEMLRDISRRFNLKLVEVAERLTEPG